MLNYAAVKVTDLERSGAFYDSILAPLGWRRQDAPAN
jgi:catechol 2,3-dioxygenase-like lactoylglutathione lyase family enzyme